MMISTTIILICVELLTIADGQRRRFSSFEMEPMQKTEMDIPSTYKSLLIILFNTK
jgi:hypothetical protein